jgi:type II secretory pathway pseudopilin PulG
MMEQLVMLLVFALAAALCVQVFVLADQTSRRNQARDQAVLAAQNAAELLKSGTGEEELRYAQAAEQLGGHYEDGQLWVDYDEDWTPVSQNGVYHLSVQGKNTGMTGLAAADISVCGDLETEPDILFQLEVDWQEVNGNG